MTIQAGLFVCLSLSTASQMALNIFVYTAKFLSPPGVFLMCKSAPELGVPAPFADN